MLDLHATILDGLQSGFACDPDRLIIDHPELQPKDLGANLNRLMRQWNALFRPPENIDNLDRLRNLGQG